LEQESAQEFSTTIMEKYVRAQFSQSEILKTLKNEFTAYSFKDMDNFLKSKRTEITCGDISAIYFKFELDLKKMKANATNFVGFSEFLILRLLLHLIKKDYYPKTNGELYGTATPFPKKISINKDLGYFDFGHGSLRVTTECIPWFKDDEELKKLWNPELANSKGHRRRSPRPDIVVYRENPQRLFSILQIKAFPASSRYVETDLSFLNKIRRIPKYKDAKVKVFVFSDFDKEKKFAEKYHITSTEEICVLYNNPEPFSKVVRPMYVDGLSSV
jgi:hypothetical protein